MSNGFTDIPDLGQNDSMEAREWLGWIEDVLDEVLWSTSGIMPPRPTVPPPPGWWEKVVAFLIASMQGLGPIIPEAEPPDLSERPA